MRRKSMAMERGLIWILVLGVLLLVAGTYGLITKKLADGMSAYDWVTGFGTLSLGAFLALTYLERKQVGRPKRHRLLVAGWWGSFGLFLLCVGIATFIGLSDAFG